MNLSKQEFAVLETLSVMPHAAQRAIADRHGISLGGVNNARKVLAARGSITADNSLTQQGVSELAPYQVQNAIILAAGLSSRFAPISYEKPKGLLKVKGEVLIERQIEQLLSTGIKDISVVVGYKKEHFFYLEEKYGVSLVVNTEYDTRNNSSSLMAVRNRLGNTYICSSDDYFTQNPFRKNEWKAYYSAQYAEGKTDEWCLLTDRSGRIIGVSIGGENSWYMIGHAYFDQSFSDSFVRYLEEDYAKPGAEQQFWEDVFVSHIDELEMIVKRYGADEMYEFDSLDQLRSFDPHFIENVDSEALNNIVSVLHCNKNDICDIYPLKQGLTNLSCHFRVGDSEYVYRHPGVGTEHLIDRNAEEKALHIASDLGLDGTFIFEDPIRGWKLSRFIPNCKTLDPHSEEDLSQAMRMARLLHASAATTSRYFDFYREAKRYESILREYGPIDVQGFKEMSDQFDELESFVAADHAPICLCHNDFFALNILIDKDGNYTLIDWEYAGMSDYANDFGTFCVCCQLSESEIEHALELYFERTPSLEERRHNLAHIALAGWCWYLWSLVKEAEGESVGEWLYIYYNYGKTYLGKALALYR